MIACPECGSDALSIRAGAGKDLDTGSFDPDYVHCSECGGSFGFEEMDRFTQEANDAERILESAAH